MVCYCDTTLTYDNIAQHGACRAAARAADEREAEAIARAVAFCDAVGLAADDSRRATFIGRARLAAVLP